MSGLGVLIPCLLFGTAVLLWPGRRHRSTTSAVGLAWSAVGAGAGGRSRETARRAAQHGDGAFSAVSGASGALRSVWHQDPVELVRAWRLRRRPESLVDSALDLLDGIRPALEAGLSPGRAVEIAATSSMGHERFRRLRHAVAGSGPVGRREAERLVESLLDAAEAGDGMASVWADSAQRSGSADLGFVAAAWGLTESTGAPLAAAVGRAADGLRDARTRRGRVAVAVAGPKATVTVLTVLPLTGPLFGLACGVDPVSLYVSSVLASASVLVGLGLILLGRLWCTRIVRAAVSA